MSNYPPGVTGNEWQIAGHSAEAEDRYEEYLDEYEADRRRAFHTFLAEGRDDPAIYEVFCAECYDEPLDFGDFLDKLVEDYEDQRP